MTIHNKMYVFGILLVCGFLFTSVDDCESRYMVEQDEAAAAPEKSGENTAQTGSTGAGHLSTIMGKEWKLSEIRLSGKTTMIDRNKLSADGMGDIFTFTVDSIRISGKAAPNRYASVYQAGVNNSLTIQAPVSTMMASIYDLKGVREQEYFQYLSRVKSWNVNQDKLELYTTDTNNKEVVLVYVN